MVGMDATPHIDPRALTDRLHRLPWLATLAARHDPDTTSRRPGSRLPPGAGPVLARIDRGREQPDQLAKLGGCIRAVCEESDMRHLPDLEPEGHQTWRTEVDWLIATTPTWITDDWLATWIDGRTAEIERTLNDRSDQHATPEPAVMVCYLCGSPLTALERGDLAVAQCSRCDRVVGMRMLVDPHEAEQRRRAAILNGARKLLGLTQQQ